MGLAHQRPLRLPLPVSAVPGSRSVVGLISRGRLAAVMGVVGRVFVLVVAEGGVVVVEGGLVVAW